jgi:hypothetical protein
VELVQLIKDLLEDILKAVHHRVVVEEQVELELIVIILLQHYLMGV